MNILITNDDGINAPGISLLAEAAAQFGNVTVVAPASQCSAMSHRITLDRPMGLRKHEWGMDGVTAYSLDGTPADCIRAALDAIMPEKPDVVLSGINLPSYGLDTGVSLVSLIEQAATVPGIRRIRLGSLEPDLMTEEMIARMVDAGIFKDDVNGND